MILNPQALFFDFDGVIAQSVGIKTEAFSKLYESHGSAIQQQVVAYHLAHGGVSRFEKFRYFEQELMGREPDEMSIDRLSTRFSDLVKQGVIGAAPVPGAQELLAYHEGNTPMFVISGTPEVELLEIVQARGLSHFFEAVRGSPATKEEILRDLLDNYGFDSVHCVMLGDAMTDFHAAQTVGVPFVGICPSNGSSPFPRATETYPDLRPLLPSPKVA